jgi:hypothetical protein
MIQTHHEIDPNDTEKKEIVLCQAEKPFEKMLNNDVNLQFYVKMNVNLF